MVIEVSPFTVGATLGIAILGLSLSVLFDTFRQEPVGRSLATGFLVSAVGWCAWLVALAIARPSLDGAVAAQLVALCGVATVLATEPLKAGGVPVTTRLAFGAVFAVVVFAPIAMSLFSLRTGFLGATLGTLDLAGALPVLVAPGGTGLAVLLARRNRPEQTEFHVRPGLALACTFAVVWLTWGVWLVGLELVFDETTSRIILNTLIAPPISALAWLVIQRMRHAETTVTAAVAGLFCGLVAIAPGCAYLDPTGAGLTALVAGSVCSLVGYGLVARTRDAVWILVTILVVAASLGVVLLGAFATMAGLMFTGQPEVLIGQLASAVLVILYSSVASFALWLAINAVFTRRMGSWNM